MDEAAARLRGSQRVLEHGAGEVEHVAVALGELPLGASQGDDDRVSALGAHADRDLVLDAGGVEEVAVQLAARQGSGVGELGQPHGGASAGRVRGQDRMVSGRLDDRVEGAVELRLSRERVVVDGARGGLDPVPREEVRGDELGERMDDASPQVGLCRSVDHPSGELVRGAHVCVGEPGHGVTSEHTPRRDPDGERARR